MVIISRKKVPFYLPNSPPKKWLWQVCCDSPREMQLVTPGSRFPSADKIAPEGLCRTDSAFYLGF